MRDLDKAKCYTITKAWITGGPKHLMAHHHHEPGAHPVTISPSILRLSAWERLAVVAVIVAALWGAVHWAVT
jgi:hypothetical protein